MKYVDFEPIKKKENEKIKMMFEGLEEEDIKFPIPKITMRIRIREWWEKAKKREEIYGVPYIIILMILINFLFINRYLPFNEGVKGVVGFSLLFATLFCTVIIAIIIPTVEPKVPKECISCVMRNIGTIEDCKKCEFGKWRSEEELRKMFEEKKEC